MMAPPLPALLALFLVALLPPLARSDLGAHYVKSPESVTAPLGDEVEFPCQTNIAAERVAWRHRPAGGSWTDVPLPPAALTAPGAALRITSKPAQSRLTVHLHNESLAGDYRCVSWYGVSVLASVSGKLVVAELGPTPRLPDRRLQAAHGASVLVRCPPPKSEPPANILYYKMQGGVRVDVSGGSDGVQEAGGAILVKARGQTTYTCEAINNLSGQTHPYHHKIIVDAQDGPRQAPTFTEDMAEEMEGVAGTAVWLGCGALGRPAPRFSWRRRGSALPSRTAEKGALLHITDLKTEDEGVYICEASNGVGTAERSVRLSVLSAPSLVVTGGHGEVTGGQRVVTASEGGEVKLPCGRANGNPAPTISWLINGEEVIEDSNVKILDSELEINPIEKRHAGVVQCFAANSLGSATIVNLLHVIPRQHAQMDGSDPGFGELGVIRQVNPGSNERRHSRPKGHHKGTVMIPPSSPNITRLSDESVMVRWSVQHNTGLRIEFFKVQYRDISQPYGGSSTWNTSNQDIPAHVRSYEVNGLQPDHYYRFRIAAAYSNNDNKLGPKSAKFHLKRGSGLALPPPAPLLTGAEPVSPTEIKLHWQLPTGNTTTGKETPVEGYYVYYRLASSAGDYVKAYVEGGNAESLVLRHLTPDTSYEIKLQSFTPTAASDFSAIITKKTLKAPVVEKVMETGSPQVGASGPSNGDSAGDKGQVYLIAGGAAGGAAVLGAVVIALVVYKKKKGGAPDKQREGGTGGELPNGFLPPSASPKPAITITTNPLHPEGEGVDMEMSYISAQNNNGSSRSPRSSAEMVVANSRRDDLRKQGPVSSAPARENYV